MTNTTTHTFDFLAAAARLKDTVLHTPLEYNERLSEKYQAEIYLKREDKQVVRSYKLRGAYNMMSQIPADQIQNGVVCASAGNHAQGVAYSCKKLKIKGTIFMPEITPKQKVNQTTLFGNGWINIVLVGDTFDDCLAEALKFTAENNMTFVPPFDHYHVIEGQGTVGVEILEDLPATEVVIMPIGGGGLASGTGTYLKETNPNILLIGVEPEGAPSMEAAFKAGRPIKLDQINRFIDGAAVKSVGLLTYPICKSVLDEIMLIPEAAGALAVASLDLCAEHIKGKKVVCIVSGGNNDIERMQEIKEKSLLFEGLKHYFIVRFPQRPGALKLFVNEVLGPYDDITRFEFIKKTERESGPALVGIELKDREDYQGLLERMKTFKFDIIELNQEQTLFEYLV